MSGMAYRCLIIAEWVLRYVPVCGSLRVKVVRAILIRMADSHPNSQAGRRGAAFLRRTAANLTIGDLRNVYSASDE
jgi:hypothetical protein